MPCASCKPTTNVNTRCKTNVRLSAEALTSDVKDVDTMADIDMGDDRTPLINRGSGESPQRHSKGFRFLELMRPCLAEFVGVILFVFLGTTSATSGNVVAVAMAHGLTIMLLIISFGQLSGGHFNPCVSLGAMIGGGISPWKMLAYWVVQLLGGIIGAGFTKGMLPDAKYMAINGGIPDLGQDVSIGQGIFGEAVLTFLLVLTVLMAAVDRSDNLLAPIAIGLAVAVDISAAGDITGAVMNPARSFGPAIVGTSTFSSNAWTHQYIYWAGPMTGATLAGLMHRFLLGSPGKRFIFKE